MNCYAEQKPQVVWAYYNFGVLIGTAYRRKDAVRAVEADTGQQWATARKYMQIRKAIVSPVVDAAGVKK